MITHGTILVAQGTSVPTCFHLGSASYPGEWMSVAVNLDAGMLEAELASTGWTFFYIAGEVSTSAFGFDRRKATDAALKRLIAGARKQNCNCLEIDDVVSHTFLGMPWVTVSAHTRRIQKGSTFIEGSAVELAAR
jgi:hypothetical protein